MSWSRAYPDWSGALQAANAARRLSGAPAQARTDRSAGLSETDVSMFRSDRTGPLHAFQVSGPWSRRRALRLGLLGGVTLAAGCGLRPMYFPGNGESSVPEFALIRVEAIATRTGQILRNGLLDRLTPQGEPATPRYKLHAKIAIQSVSLAIQPDASVTRFNLLLKVQFELADIDTGEVIYRDSMRSVGSYNAVRSDYATLIAEQDTARRSAVSASEEIAALLAVFFARRSTLDD